MWGNTDDECDARGLKMIRDKRKNNRIEFGLFSREKIAMGAKHAFFIEQ